jgi:hypothetical protein
MEKFRYKEDTLGGFLCRYKKEYFQKVVSYGGLAKRVGLEEKECHYNRHDDRCVYRITIAS